MFSIFNKLKNYKDKDITFYLQVYRDFSLAAGCLKRLRRAYPDSRVITLSDGDDDARYQSFEHLFGVEYHKEKRLYCVGSGGEMLQRMFEIFLRKPTSYLIKIDTDTRVDRRFWRLPGDKALYGMYVKGKRRVLQGGAIMIPFALAEKIHASRLLKSDELKSNPKGTWGRRLSERLYNERVDVLGLVGFEWVLKWVCDQMKINTKEFREIYSTWKIPCENKNLKYAVVHPDKEMKD